MAATLTWIILCLLFSRFLSQQCNHIRNGIREWFCCNNHELRDGICVECKEGFIAKDGFPCEPCPAGAWGRKCRGSCGDCQPDQSCDAVSGCINIFNRSSTYRSTDSVSFTEDLHQTSSIVTLSDKETVDKLLPRETIIYTSGTVMLLLISIVCATCFCYKEKIVKLFRISTQNQMLVEADDNDRMPSNDQIESHYISLDDVTEQDLGSSVDNTVNFRARDELIPSNNSDLAGKERYSVALPIPLATTPSSDNTDDGYLHPRGHGHHRESPQNNDSSVDSSDSDVTSPNDTCHNPYQPEVSPIDKENKHQYQAEVTPLNREYLQPYQSEETPLNREYLQPYQPEVTPLNRDYLQPYQPEVTLLNREYLQPYQPVGKIVDVHVYEQRHETESDSSDKYTEADKYVHVDSTSDVGLKSNPTYDKTLITE